MAEVQKLPNIHFRIVVLKAIGTCDILTPFTVRVFFVHFQDVHSGCTGYTD